MTKHQIVIDKSKCVGCKMCVNDCVAHNIVLKNNKANIIANDCVMCGHCVAICPKEAVVMTGYEENPISRERVVSLNPDDVLNVIRHRRTIRQFQNKKVPAEILNQILEAGRLTHTAKNMQDVSFIVLDKKKHAVEKQAVKIFGILQKAGGVVSPMIKRNKIGEHFFFFKAPVVIVVAAKSVMNGSLAAQNMEFVAEANGLGTLFSGYFTLAARLSRNIRKQLGVPKGKKVIMTLVMGYPNVKYQRSVQREKLKVDYR
ncbi:MAG: nitroreductase family protein [Lachnospiraceae bacterium]|nr:nitroreductase family protein [Lachnospiraceae bacterium]